MKSGEYLQIIRFINSHPGFIGFYCTKNKIDWYECYQRFDEMRNLQLKLKKECDAYNIYPHHDLEKISLLSNEIKNVCKEFNITPVFSQYRSTEYKQGLYVNYYFENIKITDLICFYEKRTPQIVSIFDN